ncbi:MAG: hypothetical protein IJ662_07205 [Clostridia bacterium]|nr:hypothetical protein [Clostridia bacterium]
MTKKKRYIAWLRVALISLGLHYLTLILCQFLIQGGFSLSGFLDLIRERLTQPGDAVRYIDIAGNGYVREGENAINLVFYPLYPWLMRALSYFTGSLPAAGVLLSQCSYAAASIFLYEWLILDGRDAWFGVLLLALYPFSVFVMGVYTEGLFLLLTVSCLFCIRTRRFAWAGITGFLAALCRTQGMLLIFPAVYELVALRLSGEKRKFRWTDAFVLLIPLGFCVYLGINYALHGNAFQFLQYEAGEPWYQTSEWIGRNIALQWTLGHEYKGLEWIIYYPQVALYFIALGVLLYGALKRDWTAGLLYGGAYLGFTYLSGWMISGGRYMLGCVPLIMVLSNVKKPMVKNILLLTTALLHFAYSLFFYMGHSIM